MVRLRYLAAVARTGSVRAAAAALDVTPSAVSTGITRLQAECGIGLVDPDARGILLTRDGEWLARRAEHLVGEVASLKHDLTARRSHEPGIRIAGYDVFATWFASQLATRYLPDVPLTVRDRWPGEVEESVASGSSDVGITLAPVPLAGVRHVEVAQVPISTFARHGTFRIARFEELPFAVPSHPMHGATGTHGSLDGWPVDAPLRNVRFHTSSLEARLELCRAGVAVILLPDFVAAMHDRRMPAPSRLEQVALPRQLQPIVRRVYVVRRTGTSGVLQSRIDAVEAAARATCADGA